MLSVPGAVSLHAFNYDRQQNTVRFDVVVDFSVRDFAAFRARAAEKIRRSYPGIDVFIHVDLDYA